MKRDFNKFRFAGLGFKEKSNKYFTMNRISEDANKIVVRVSDKHLKKTKYGYALVLDYNHVIFVKDWQVDQNYFGNEVILTKEYFLVKEWGNFDEFEESPENLTWEKWLSIANSQSEVDEFGLPKTPVEWTK